VPSAEAIAAAVDIASREEMDPNGDIHASALFKRHLARVLAGRALRAASERAAA
jgi:carbon-monoxide dehydrogenase medium subunit